MIKLVIREQMSKLEGTSPGNQPKATVLQKWGHTISAPSSRDCRQFWESRQPAGRRAARLRKARVELSANKL